MRLLKIVAVAHRQQSIFNDDAESFRLTDSIIDRQDHKPDEPLDEKPQGNRVMRDETEAEEESAEEEQDEAEGDEGNGEAKSDEEEAESDEASPRKTKTTEAAYHEPRDRPTETPKGQPAMRWFSMFCDGSTFSHLLRAYVTSTEYFELRQQLPLGGMHLHQNNVHFCNQLIYDVLGTGAFAAVGMTSMPTHKMILAGDLKKAYGVTQVCCSSILSELAHDFIFSPDSKMCEGCHNEVCNMRDQANQLKEARDAAYGNITNGRAGDAMVDDPAAGPKSADNFDDCLPLRPYEEIMNSNIRECKLAKARIAAERCVTPLDPEGRKDLLHFVKEAVMDAPAHAMSWASTQLLLKLAARPCCLTAAALEKNGMSSRDPSVVERTTLLFQAILPTVLFKEAMQRGEPALGEACNRRLLPVKSARGSTNYLSYLAGEEYVKLHETLEKRNATVLKRLPSTARVATRSASKALG